MNVVSNFPFIMIACEEGQACSFSNIGKGGSGESKNLQEKLSEGCQRFHPHHNVTYTNEPSWTIHTGTKYISSKSFWANMCALPCIRFRWKQKQQSRLLTYANHIQGSEYILVKYYVELICCVPVSIVQNCTCTYTHTHILKGREMTVWRHFFHLRTRIHIRTHVFTAIRTFSYQV